MNAPVRQEILLRGRGAGGMRPTLIARSQDEDLIGNLLRDLSGNWPEGGGWPQAVEALRVKSGKDGNGRLYQPIHRMFNLVLLEACCASFGEPRLDPNKIESAGFVVRRWSATDKRWQAWSGTPKDKPVPKPDLRWRTLHGRDEEDADPDPARRPPRVRSGHPGIDALLAARFGGEPMTERSTSLFTAPPEVCQAAGRTVLYGMLSVVSDERVQGGGAGPFADAQGREKIERHIHDWLKTTVTVSLGMGGEPFDARWIAPEGFSEAVRASAEFNNVLNLLRQLVFEFDAFGPSPASQKLAAALAKIRVAYAEGSPLVTWREESALPFLREAARVLTDDSASGAILPHRILPVAAETAREIRHSALAVLETRAAEALPDEERFGDASATYAVRAFVRVRHQPECPPRIVWSEYSAPFAIAAWWESAGRPAVRVALPDFSADTLSKMKPNVAFLLPESLQALLGNSPDDFLAGKAKKRASNFGIDWLCSFSLPIITLCAFISLNIFLQLFDLIFRWMAYLKICIPIPKR